MTTELKLSIFVGSTKKDLHKIRDAAINAILCAGHIPSGMELWAAGHIPTLEAIKSHLELCDMHLLFLGSRYGSVVRDGKSFTQWEYEQSVEAGRPVIPFVLSEKEFDEALKRETNPDEKLNHEKLREFRNTLLENSLCGEFIASSTKGIAFNCANSINQIINSGQLPDGAGWLRSTSERGRRLQAVERNEFLQRILDRIYGFSTLTDRLEKGPYLKHVLGRFFWQVMLGRIKRKDYYNVFFESGSTLAYVSSEFEKKLNEAGGDHSRWRISTNNALTLLQLLLHTHLHVIPRPAGSPEDYYGAMFDAVLIRDPESPPLTPRGLFKAEANAVDQTVATLQPDEKKRLFLATASGLDLRHEQPHFRGPHVGSHPNMLFKRAIFQTGQPVVLFLNGWKITGKSYLFQVGKCYPVFGPDLPWSTAATNFPVAICVGYGIPDPQKTYDENIGDICAKRDSLLDALQESDELENFNFEYARTEDQSAGAFLIANPKFEKIFPVE